MTEIAKNLLAKRKALGLTQHQMAEYLAIPERSYRAYETGDRKIPLDVILALSEKVDGFDANEFLGLVLYGNDGALEGYRELFEAYDQARRAYEAFEAKNIGWSEAPDKDRAQIWEAGKRLNRVGGYLAMRAAVRSFFPDKAGRTLAAGDALNHLWNGIGEWRA